jgi:protein-S-isoprenylcysteine O-methyltransferase Ste14
MSKKERNKLRSTGIKQLILASFMLLIQFSVFSVFAGNIGQRQLIYFGAAIVHSSVSIAVQYKLSPELLVQRLVIEREGSKSWDEILMRISNLMIIVAIPAAAGLDVGRLHWPTIERYFILVGIVLLGISTILLNWAMVANPHFESTVRIQKDRDHKVIKTGPYRTVRHPGYLSGILFALSIPLLIGSMISIIPTGIYIILIIIRTFLEDRTLLQELDGYSEYAKQVKYRVFPGIW